MTSGRAPLTADELAVLRQAERLLANPNLPPEMRAQLEAAAAPLLLAQEKPTFHEYAQSFTSWQFHRWQVEILIPLIQRLSTEKGLRILFHAPPQYGKSHLLSVRGPAWLMGMRPDIKIGLACYNIKKSADFAKETRDILLDPKHLEWFPDPDGHIPKGAPESGFSTYARKAKRDAQPSLNAMGLQSGFVGLGIGPGDLLIIDDPYSDPKQAQSETENGNVINFWKRAARPRVNEHANVIVMFHRYVDLDLCGVLLEEGGWEYIRLPALADENEDGADPTRLVQYAGIREPDGRLSPLNSMSWLNAQRAADPFVFLGQFQGTPRVAGGNLFKEEWFRNYSVTASGDAYLVNGEVILRERCWTFQTVDLAASEKTTADYTVIATWAVTPARQLLLLHVERVRVEGPKVKQLIHGQYRRWRPSFIAIERNGLGMPIVQDLIAGDREYPALPIRGIWAHRDKLSYATGAAARYQAGQIYHPS